MELVIAQDYQEYDKFVLNHKYGNIMQTSYWAQIKKDSWLPHYLLFKEDDTIIASALLLQRKFKFGFSFFYCSRGFVCDFDNEKVVEEIIHMIKKYVGKNNGFVCEFDPEIPLKVIDTLNMDELYNNETSFTMLNKYAHNKGLNMDIGGSNQPRFQAIVDLSFDEVLNTRVKGKRKIPLKENYAIKRGVSVHDITDNEGVKIFAELIKRTEQKQNVNLRNEDYFMNMLNTFAKDDLIKIFATKIDMNILLDFLVSGDHDQKYIDDAKTIIANEGQFIYTNAIIYILGTNMVQMFYAASDERFNRYNPGGRLYLYGMEWAKANNFSFVNLGGVSGTLDDHLYMYKSTFKPYIYEYMGDFQIVIKPLVNKLFNLSKNIYKKIR